MKKGRYNGEKERNETRLQQKNECDLNISV